MFITVYSISVTVIWISTTIWLLINTAKIPYLKNVISSPGSPAPTVAVVIAVRNEEAELEQALLSVCHLDYPNYRIVVINDRSTDRTPQILDRMAAVNSRISIITIKDLPSGWLGKNYALYKGYKASCEEWLLFTDADILYSKRALKKAMTYALDKHLDHLTIMPQITSKSAVFKSVMNTFFVMLEVWQRPWAVSNPSSNAFIGIGAFNLVKRSAYEKAGTHKPISLRPDDDLKLGQSIKKAGLRQAVVYGNEEISLAWYNNLNEFINGLMKNMFSASNYRLPVAIGMAVGTFAVFVLPIPLLLFSGYPGILMAAAIVITQTVLMLRKKGANGKWWHGLMITFAGAVMVYIIIKSALKTIKQGGIYWRDSFYSLQELRSQQ